MKVSDLRVTQSSIRNPVRVGEMVEFVRNGGVFTLDHVAEFHQGEGVFPLISISRFPDGSVYVHDGHHRTLSAHIAGRDWLLPEEYTVRDWDSLDRYNEVNLSAGWVTPLDLESEVRVPDVYAFKSAVLSMDPADAVAYIAGNRHLYSVPRTAFTVPEFAERYLSGIL